MSVMLRYFYKNTHVSFTVNKLRYSSQVILLIVIFSSHGSVSLRKCKYLFNFTKFDFEGICPSL